MEVVARIDAVRRAVAEAKRQGRTVGFVPTMGALHAGHGRLIEVARADCGYVVVSIFVNPTQFAPHEDLQKYPRPLERDLDLCARLGADLVFTPTVEEMYPPGALTIVHVNQLSTLLEGAIRPTHFQGVTTVVTKLFGIVTPDRAYFGQKDYQQQLILRTMVRDLNLPVTMHTVETIREADGLAMSSRNVYLSPEQRQAGLCLSQALRRGGQLHADGRPPAEIARAMSDQIEQTPGVILDYATVVDPWTLSSLTERQPTAVGLVAARLGTTRLIDNAIWGPSPYY